MDYIVLSTLRHAATKTMLLSYDIACQWHKKLGARIESFPTDMQLDTSNVRLRFTVPKFHLPAHGNSCRTRFSLNFLPEVGRTYGEGVEQEWSHINGIASSTKEMAPGVRHETLCDHWSSWNWRKVVGMGTCALCLFVVKVYLLTEE